MEVKNIQYSHSAMIVGLLLLDQLLKYVFNVNPNTLTLIPNLMDLTISQESKFMGWLQINFFLFPAILYIFVLAIIYWNKSFFYQRPYALVFLLAGITSNFLDRTVLGYVRDYINVEGFVSFNLADVMIVAGVGLLAMFKLFKIK